MPLVIVRAARRPAAVRQSSRSASCSASAHQELEGLTPEQFYADAAARERFLAAMRAENGVVDGLEQTLRRMRRLDLSRRDHLAPDRVRGRAGVRHLGRRSDRAARRRGRDPAAARDPAPEREAGGTGRPAGRRRARAEQSAVGGRRLFQHARGAGPGRRPPASARRGCTLRPSAAPGSSRPSSPWPAHARRSTGRLRWVRCSRTRSSSPATACAPPTSRSCASCRPSCRRSGATATSCTR